MRKLHAKVVVQLKQKEDEFYAVKKELFCLQNNDRINRQELSVYREGDNFRKEIDTVRKNEVARLSELLTAEKSNSEQSERRYKEREVRFRKEERRFREELHATKQKLHITVIEAEKNLKFFEAQSEVHEKLKEQHLEDLMLVEKGRLSEVDDLNRKIKELKGEIMSSPRVLSPGFEKYASPSVSEK